MGKAGTVPSTKPGSAQGAASPEPDWASELAHKIAAEVRYWRERRGLSAQQLAERTRQLGHHVPRNVVANLENGRRETLSIAEVLILAAALDVPPVLLVAPVGRKRYVQLLPEVVATSWEARGWIHGATEPQYSGASAVHWQESRRAVILFDMHRLLVREHEQIERRVQRFSESSPGAPGDMIAEIFRRERGSVEEYVTELVYSLDRIKQHRRLMQSEGYDLPELPPRLAIRLRERTQAGRHHFDGQVEQPDSSLLPAVLYHELKDSSLNPSAGERDISDPATPL
jgi:transcriptional regulator with XRE-family HTH domain